MIYPRNTIRGTLFGVAFGDALGAETEFLTVEEILHKWPPTGPTGLYGTPSLVTDDTQMTIAVGNALTSEGLNREYTPQKMEPLLRTEFVNWSRSPDNNRAPGLTCMGSCNRLAHEMQWQQATDRHSKGCGANMRVVPCAFTPPEICGPLAQFQAALTHAHPTALAASDITAFIIAQLASGLQPAQLLDNILDYIQVRRSVYETEWLGKLWQLSDAHSPEEFIEVGWDECLNVIQNVGSAIAIYDGLSDPCLLTGEGWIAEEAMGTALLCFLTYPNNPVQAISRAAVTCGDSDSIACLAGAFAGAYLGDAAWPAEWYHQIEYAGKLEAIANHLAE